MSDFLAHAVSSGRHRAYQRGSSSGGTAPDAPPRSPCRLFPSEATLDKARAFGPSRARRTVSLNPSSARASQKQLPVPEMPVRSSLRDSGALRQQSQAELFRAFGLQGLDWPQPSEALRGDGHGGSCRSVSPCTSVYLDMLSLPTLVGIM